MASAYVPRPRRSEIALPLPAEGSHLQVVRQGVRARQIRLTPRAGVTMVVLLFVALFLVAVSHALLIESQIRLDDLDKQVSEEQAQYEDLREEVAELESPARIQEAATEMGMVPPGETVWIGAEQPAAPTDDGADGDDGAEEGSPNTSHSDVKPYLGSTP
jgi:cell division protein FtsL